MQWLQQSLAALVLVGVARVPGCLRISYDELRISHYAGAAYWYGEEMKVAVSVSGPLPVPCIASNKATLQRPSPESFSIQARVIQLQIDRLASSSCMRYESQAAAHVQTNADGCAGTNNRDVRLLFLTQVSSTTKASTSLRTESYLTSA